MPRRRKGDGDGGAGEDPRSPLARAVAAKGYHPVTTGPYTVR
jgi:UDP-glucose 4-epimerase